MTTKNIPFRRVLKHILKNAQRIQRSEEDRQAYLWGQLIPLGLWVNNFSELSMVLHGKHKWGKNFLKSKAIRRIGNAAKKQGMVVSLWSMAWSKAVIPLNGPKGPHEIPFFRPCILNTPDKPIIWKVWPAKQVECKIGA